MLLVANLVNKNMQETFKMMKPWLTGTSLKVLSEVFFTGPKPFLEICTGLGPAVHC